MASVAWKPSSIGIYKSDPNAFLFSLVNKDNRPLKVKVKTDQIQHAIICNSCYGPVFSDINISDNCNTNSDSYSGLGWSYIHPQYRR